MRTVFTVTGVQATGLSTTFGGPPSPVEATVELAAGAEEIRFSGWTDEIPRVGDRYTVTLKPEETTR